MGVYSQTEEQATYFHVKENLWDKPQELHVPGCPRNRKRPVTNSTSFCSCVTLLTNYKSKANSERKTQGAQNCRKQTRKPSSPKALPSDLTFQGQRPDPSWGDRLRVTEPAEDAWESHSAWSQHVIQLHRTILPSCGQADHQVGNRNQLWEWMQIL